jgi:hypothetical protein
MSVYLARKPGRAYDPIVTVPDAPHVHVYLARGGAVGGGSSLGPGDAALLTDAGAVALTSVGDAEVLVWATA